MLTHGAICFCPLAGCAVRHVIDAGRRWIILRLLPPARIAFRPLRRSSRRPAPNLLSSAVWYNLCVQIFSKSKNLNPETRFMKRVFAARIDIYLMGTAFCTDLSDRSFAIVRAAIALRSAVRKNDSPASKTAAQPVDAAYTESIIKNTTDKMFLTEIVDHCPLPQRCRRRRRCSAIRSGRRTN